MSLLGQLCGKGFLAAANSLMKLLLDSAIAYFSAVAMWCNLWRDTGTARAVFTTTEQLYGPVAALQWAKRIAPQCIAGRWLAIDHAEDFLLTPKDWTQVMSVMIVVLEKRLEKLNLEALEDKELEVEATESASDPNTPRRKSPGLPEGKQEGPGA